MAFTGRIIEEQKNFYLLDSPQGMVRVGTRGVLKKEKKRVCVGDLVDYEITNTDALEGVIHAIHERTSYLLRPPLANLDQVFCVCTLKEPPLDLEALDRLLLCVKAYSMTPVLVFNKSDRLSAEERPQLEKIVAVYRRAGFAVIVTSAVDGSGIDEILRLCEGRLSAFAGLSGVGKSALLQKIFPDREFRLGDVSGATGRGTHTTTTATLFRLPQAHGYVADTPGIAFVDLPRIPEEDVAAYFPELDAQIGRCRFNNCIHGSEPGCSVRAKVDSGEIAAWRVENYLKIFKEMREKRREYKKK